MPSKQSTPAPLETDPGEQQDDNIDDFGHRPDGAEQDQPMTPDALETDGDPAGDKSRSRTR